MSEPGQALPTTLGGQAVVEGVMIRGPQGMAVCVRKPDGELAVRTERVDHIPSLQGLPILRGITTLGDTFTQGIRALIWSAQVAAGQEPEEPSDGQVRTTMATSLGFATALFLFLPAVAGRRLERVVKRPRLASLMEGPVRLGMLIGYLRVIGRLPQAQRLFAYHGAEHRAIQAYEANEPLEVSSLRRFPNAHIRCGTSFLLTTMLISSLVYASLGPLSPGRRILSRLALTPLIAGLSYETIRLGSAAPAGLSRWLFRPNLALQALTTRDPDESQMEVALAALHAALALHKSG